MEVKYQFTYHPKPSDTLHVDRLNFYSTENFTRMCVVPLPLGNEDEPFGSNLSIDLWDDNRDDIRVSHKKIQMIRLELILNFRDEWDIIQSTEIKITLSEEDDMYQKLVEKIFDRYGYLELPYMEMTSTIPDPTIGKLFCSIIIPEELKKEEMRRIQQEALKEILS